MPYQIHGVGARILGKAIYLLLLHIQIPPYKIRNIPPLHTHRHGRMVALEVDKHPDSSESVRGHGVPSRGTRDGDRLGPIGLNGDGIGFLGPGWVCAALTLQVRG